MVSTPKGYTRPTTEPASTSKTPMGKRPVTGFVNKAKTLDLEESPVIDTMSKSKTLRPKRDPTTGLVRTSKALHFEKRPLHGLSTPKAKRQMTLQWKGNAGGIV